MVGRIQAKQPQKSAGHAEHNLDKVSNRVDQVGNGVALTAQKAQQGVERLIHHRKPGPDDSESEE